MADITTQAESARENARQDSGRFGAQEHSAPEATLNGDPEATTIDAARAKLASHRAEVVALREQLALSESAMRTAEDDVMRAVVLARYPGASILTTWNTDFAPVTAYDSTGTRIGPHTPDEHLELFTEIREALDDEALPKQDMPSIYQRRKVRHDLDGITAGKGPWVLISTANDAVPVISDHADFPFPENERHEWREATDAEIERYETHWDAQF